jgi:hypothetical protein
MMIGTKVTTGTDVTTGTNIATSTEVATGTEAATGVGTDIPIGMVIRTTAIKTTGDQPVFQGEYPGWSFEPGCVQALLFYEGVEGRGPLRQWLAEAPKS